MLSVVADTNVFLCFLTNDISSQSKSIEKRFKDAQEGRLLLAVLPITVVEILFQLENWYKFSRQDAVEKLILLFSPSWLELEDKEAVFEALTIYKESKIDFVDILTFSMAKKRNAQILSFDKDYDKLSPKLRLEP